MRIQRNDIIRKCVIVSLITLAMKHSYASDECRTIFDNKIKSPFFTTVTTHNDKSQAIKEIHKMMPDENAQDYTIIAYIQQILPSKKQPIAQEITNHSQLTNQNFKTRDFLLTWTSKQHAIQFINEHALDQNQHIYLTVVRKENIDTKSTTTSSPDSVIQKLEKLSSNLENALKNVKDKKNRFQHTIMAIKNDYWTAQIAQNTWPKLKNNITYMINMMKKELTPTELHSITQNKPTPTEIQNMTQKELTPNELNVIVARLQNEDQNYTNAIPVFHISHDTVEKKIIHFNEIISDINRLRSEIAEAAELVITKEMMLKDAAIKAKEIWPSVNLITQAIENAIKTHLTTTELEEIMKKKGYQQRYQEDPSQNQNTAPLQVKNPHEKKDDIPTGSNVIRFPSQIERLRR